MFTLKFPVGNLLLPCIYLDLFISCWPQDPSISLTTHIPKMLLPFFILFYEFWCILDSNPRRTSLFFSMLLLSVLSMYLSISSSLVSHFYLLNATFLSCQIHYISFLKILLVLDFVFCFNRINISYLDLYSHQNVPIFIRIIHFMYFIVLSSYFPFCIVALLLLKHK